MNKRTFLLLLALVPFIAITNATAKTKITYKGKKVKVKDFYKKAEKNRQYDINFKGKELKGLTSKEILELYKQNKKQAKKIHKQTKKHAKTSYKNTARTTQTKKLRKKTKKQARTLYKEKKEAAKKLYKKTKESFGLC